MQVSRGLSLTASLKALLVGCRYFLHSWPRLCWLAFDGSQCFGVVVCKADDHKGILRGYIAMLVVKTAYRGLGVGKRKLPLL